VYYLFIIAGAAAAIHAFTYGRWLRRQGNVAGSIFCFVVAAAAAVLPAAQMMLK
jgi:hypothetical protein